MRPRLLFTALLVACVCVVGLRAQQQITLLANVLDPATGAPVETLTPEDVRVTEDGAVAKVTKVEAANRVVKVQLLIDNGIGIGGNISDLRTGVRKLVEALPPDVETTLVTTAPQGRILVRPTRSREDLLKGVDRLTSDSATGRFTETLIEAADRANRDKDTFTVMIAAGTTSGDGHIQSGHIKELMGKMQGRPMIVHVLMYSGERSATGGDAQIDVGQRVTKATGGRYEYINSMNRYATLLPELGTEVAKQLTGNTRQFRITVQRPENKPQLGRLSMSAGARIVSSVRVE